MIKIVFSLFVAGLIFGSGPCMASCGPILLSYIAGTKKNLANSLFIYLGFSLSRISTYLVLSLVIFFFGRFALDTLLGDIYGFISLLGGVFIILVGILMLSGNRLEISKLTKFLQKNILERDIKNVIVFGLVIGFLPCAPLLAMLSYTGLVSKTWIDSLIYSLSFGLGTILSPLLLLTVFTGFIPKFLTDKKPIYSRLLKVLCSLIVIFFGLQLLLKGF